ncbi:hypothetical protein FG379_000151 [Cryptosporidium bovis]|uniref:uncharacterized protein n=1 Tax=Cryptosporidium bovis TaxID=310047 RepID=UPI00351A80F5|nr:hypothetical protein FG379_000151 [Cryptosporidium bovis]
MNQKELEYEFTNFSNIGVSSFGENITHKHAVNTSLIEDELNSNIDYHYKTPHIEKYKYDGNKREIEDINVISVADNEKNRFIWSEIGQIVHSNRKPEYSLSSILRRTNLLGEDECDNIENKNIKYDNGVNNVENFEVNGSKNLVESNKYLNNNSKTPELLQVTDIIKNVHREEIKIYLDEIFFLRSQIINMSSNNNMTHEESYKINVGVNTFEKNELTLNKLIPVIIKCVNTNKLALENVIKIEIIQDYILNDKEKNEYITKIENLNVEIQKQLEQKNEQYASVSHEYLKQKSLLIKEKEKINILQEQIEKLNEALYKKEDSLSIELGRIKEETTIMHGKFAQLDCILATTDTILSEINYYLINNKNNVECIRLFDYVKSLILKFYGENNEIEYKVCKSILELCSSIENILTNCIKLVQKQKNTKLCNNYTQTNNLQKISINIKQQKLKSIFIQSIGSNNDSNDIEAPINVNNSFTCNYNGNYHSKPSNIDSKHNSDTDRMFYSERTLDYSSNVTSTRLRNEINILKNQLGASKQKYKLKELENERLLQEISYLKNKLVRNKASYSHNKMSINNEYGGENIFINSADVKSEYKNYHTALGKNYSRRYESPKLKKTVSCDNNWDEIFHVIQQLKDL